MITTRIQVFDKKALFGQSGALGADVRSKMLAEFAAGRIAETDRQNAEAAGRPIPHETIVDGSNTDNLARVKPDGVIVAKWQLGTEVVQWVLDTLQASGPVASGRYRESAKIYADGREVDTPEETAGASEVAIVSTVPYARKIERGQGGYAPGAVYEGVAALAAGKYGNIARIKFSYRQPVGGGTMLDEWAQGHSAKAGTERQQSKQYEKDVRNPAVVITF